MEMSYTDVTAFTAILEGLVWLFGDWRRLWRSEKNVRLSYATDLETLKSGSTPAAIYGN